MPRNRPLILLAVALGIALIAVSVIYFVSTAASLPSFFPGHQSGSSHHHTKHGIAALVVALGCFAFAWFQSGPRRPAEPGAPTGPSGA